MCFTTSISPAALESTASPSAGGAPTSQRGDAFTTAHVNILFSGSRWSFLAFSPFEVAVAEEAGPQQIRAWGPGLEGGVVARPAVFVVESVAAEVGELGEYLVSRLQDQN